jgi:glucose/arabinose dehydrogenase
MTSKAWERSMNVLSFAAGLTGRWGHAAHSAATEDRMTLARVACCLIALVTVARSAHAQTALKAELVMQGLNQPVDVQSTPAFPEYIYIVELIEPDEPVGRIMWKNVHTGATGVFFETPEDVWRGVERGLQAMVWDPHAAENGFFYVNYNDATGTNVVARFHADSATSADASSRHVVLEIGQSLTNHQSHWLGFGPSDGLLYIAVGDGGGSNDPQNRAQTIDNEWHGKLLRVNPNVDSFPVDVLKNYGVPASNPFVGRDGDDEIWAYGLRNPWRNAFDPATGDLYIADVGQGAWEEIDFEPAGFTGGANYGWRCWEGTHRSEVEPCDSPQGVPPVYEYGHDAGACAITGGVVYRGPDPDLNGRYFFGDLCSAQVWSIRMSGGAATDLREHTPLATTDGRSPQSVVSFGVDQLGGLYVVDYNGGQVFRLVPAQGVTNDCNANGWDDRSEIDLGMATDQDGGPTGVPSAGVTKFSTDCASCHGSNGSGGSAPAIRNTPRTRLWDVLLAPSAHAGGTHPQYSPADFANIEAYLSDLGTRARPDAIPDECQTLPDCDRDGTPDAAEFAAGTQRDLDFDGLPDECVTTAITSSAAPSGNLHASFVRPDGAVVVLDYDAPTQRWLATEYNRLGTPESLRAESFVDSTDGLGYVAVSARNGLHLVVPEVPGTPSRNLTSEIPGATAIVGATTSFTSLDGITFIAGMDGSGDLVAYWQTGQLDAQGRKIWSFSNFYRDHLEPQGMPRPAFTGELVSYVTPWNGLNIAGLDAAGTIWSVWWAPGLSLWRSSNLSEITGAAPIVGKLTAYVTSWGGLNLAGLDAQGQVVVTWWVPQFGGNWEKNNLSQQFGHPGLKPGELTSYVTPWGGLNIAGLDQDGQLVIYWWSPGMDQWVVSPLSALIPGAPLPASSVRGLASPTGLLSVFAFTAGDGGGGGEGDVIRYFWQPDGQWQVENVSQKATPR